MDGRSSGVGPVWMTRMGLIWCTGVLGDGFALHDVSTFAGTAKFSFPSIMKEDFLHICCNAVRYCQRSANSNVHCGRLCWCQQRTVVSELFELPVINSNGIAAQGSD
jgi:hypothetical protein